MLDRLLQFRVSVIVVNFNCLSTLNACINTILRSNKVEELLLVDNASTDTSLDSIKQLTDERLKIIRLNRNIGLAAARNYAASKARCNILAITDADIAVDPQWLDYPCLLLERHKEFGAVQCNIILTENVENIATSLLKSNNLESDISFEDKENSYNYYLFPIGAAFVIKREIWDMINGFDSSFFIGNDDVDFGIRLWSSGHKVITSNEGKVYHEFGTLRSQKHISPIFQYYGLRNMLIIWLKNLELKTIIKYVLPFTFLYPFMAVRYGGITGIRGLFSFFKNLPLILSNRLKVQQLRRISDDKIVPMMREAGTMPIDLITTDFRLFCQRIFGY